MGKYVWLVVAVLTVALSVGASTAFAAKGSNSENAKLCQKGGWEDLVRSNGTAFNSEQECVSYAAQGGTLMPKPTCTAGSDDFSDDANLSVPTMWNGGMIEGPYGTAVQEPAGVLINGLSFLGDFDAGAHVLYTGSTTSPFQLTFTNAVSSVQLDAE